MRLFGPVVEGLGRAVNLYQARHKVIAENIANVETPGYRARELDFSAALAAAFQPEPAGDAANPPDPSPDTRGRVKLDGNSVDLDTEMGRLHENSFTVQLLSRLIARQYQGLRTAISEGRS